MKKVTLAIALAALMVFAGCKKENETNGTTLKASIEQHKGNGSKTSLHPISDTEAQIHWTGDESILVNNGTSTVTFSLVSKSDDGMSGTFNYDGSFTFGENNVAVYPETATLSSDGSTVGFTLPETQTFTAESTFGEGMNPMLGTFTDPENFTMTSLCGVLGLQLTGDNIENVTSIEVESKLDEALNGEFSCTAANPVLSVVTAGTNKVKLEFQEPITLTSTAKKFYFVLPVGTLSGGFTLTVNIEGAEPITRSTTNDISIVLNCVNMMPEMPISAAPAIPDGAIGGGFSVSDTQKVYFSRGNLQYQASTNTWRFAEHQWESIGNAPGNTTVSATQSAWIDLFGWGTSGYNNKYPYMTSTTNTHYGDGNHDIAGTNYDWGVYNDILDPVTGHTVPAGTYRTLTRNEWLYLLYDREASTVSGTANARFALAYVNSLCSLILLPDDYTHPAGVTALKNINNGYCNWEENTYSGDAWDAMEAAGAVLLPFTGWRSTGGKVFFGWGMYWTSSYYSAEYAYYVEFRTSSYMVRYNGRWAGYAVRLACDIE